MSKLTPESVAKIVPGSSRKEIPDSLCPGLYLVVQTSGAKSWAVRYRADGISRKLTLGGFPAIPLAESEADKKARLAADPTSLPPDARGLARRALAAVHTGLDPAANKVAARVEAKRREAAGIAADGTFAALWAEYFANKRGELRPESRKMFERWSARFMPVLGPLELAAVSKSDVLRVLDKAYRDRGLSAANSCHMVLSSFLTWAFKRDLIVRNPMAGLEKRKETERERVLTNEELAEVWKSAEEMGGPFGAIFKVLILTGQRRGEVAGMRHSELNGREWTIPGERTKNGETHIVYLSDAVLSIIDALPRFENCDFVFSSNGKAPSANFSAAKQKLDDGTHVKDFRTHDLRRTFATGCQRLGVAPFIIERMLNHTADNSGVKKIYQRHEYRDEMVEAWARWAEHVETLAGASLKSKVVRLRRKA